MSNDATVIKRYNALEALHQVLLSPQVERHAPVATILGYHADTYCNSTDFKKRRIDDLKKTTPCFRCGTVGYWFKNSRDCTQDIQDKTARSPIMNERPAERLRRQSFRQGGQ